MIPPVTRRRLLAILAGLTAASGLSAFGASRMKTYDGPTSDHFDGVRFFDPDGAPPKSAAAVLRWQLGGNRQRQKWPDWAPNPHTDTPPARVDSTRVRLSFVGHASWLVQTAGVQAHDVPWAAIPTMGEAWHNNHHAFPGSARIGLYPGQSDWGFAVIAALARLGLVWDVVTPETMAHRRELRRVERTGVERGAGLEPEPGR